MHAAPHHHRGVSAQLRRVAENDLSDLGDPGSPRQRPDQPIEPLRHVSGGTFRRQQLRPVPRLGALLGQHHRPGPVRLVELPRPVEQRREDTQATISDHHWQVCPSGIAVLLSHRGRSRIRRIAVFLRLQPHRAGLPRCVSESAR